MMGMGKLASLKKLARYGVWSGVGKCPVCGKGTIFLSDSDNRKESCGCLHCGAITRTRMIAKALCDIFSIKYMALLPNEITVYQAQASGPIHNILREHKHYFCSEYLDGVPSGQEENGVRSEDLQDLSYPDGCFDVVLHQSVLEHVRYPKKALAECARVLRESGYLVFEVPMCDYWSPTIRGQTLARIDTSGDTDIHLRSPLYHEDPLRPEGVLVYTDFGMDAGNWLSELGFDVSWMIDRFSFSKMSHSVIAVCKKRGDRV